MTVSRSRALRVLVVLLVAAVRPFVVHAVPQTVGGERSYVGLSGSMEPAIDAGGIVVVNDVATERVSEGDVITFRREGDGTPTTHRVVDIRASDDGTYFRTRGDANEEPDPGFVPAGRVIGRVMFAVPYVGHVVSFAGTELGFVALVVAPLAALAIDELRSLLVAGGGTDAATPDVDPAGRIDDGTADRGESGGTDAAVVSVSRSDLGLPTAVLVCFALYAGWQAVLAPDHPVRVAVAVAAALGALLVGGMYASVSPTDVDPTDATPPDGE